MHMYFSKETKYIFMNESQNNYQSFLLNIENINQVNVYSVDELNAHTFQAY